MADLPTHQLSCPTDTTDPDSGPGNDYGFCYHRFNSGSPHDETVSGVARGIVWAPGHLYAATKKLHVFWSFKPVAGRHPGRVLNFHTNPVFGGWEPDNSDGVSPLALDWFGDTTHEGAEGLMLVAEAENARGGSPYHFTVCDIAEMDAALSGGTWIDIEMEIDIGLTPGASAGVKIWVNCEASPRVDVDIRTHWPSQTGYALWEGIYNSSGFPVTTTGQFVASRVGRTRAEALDDGIGSTISEQAVYGAYLQSNPTVPAWTHTVLTPRTTDDFCDDTPVGAPLVTFAYNGTNECVATITGATVGHGYRFFADDPNSGDTTGTAVTGTLVLTKSDIGGFPPDYSFAAIVYDTTTGEYIGSTVLYPGDTDEYEFDAEWDFDGVDQVSVTFFADAGVTYNLFAGNNNDYDDVSDVGADADLTLTATLPPGIGTLFSGWLYINTPYSDKATRQFAIGTAGDGYPGNPGLDQTSVTFTYNGSNEAVCTITGAVPGRTYLFTVEEPSADVGSETAVTSTVVVTISNIGVLAADFPFAGYVHEGDTLQMVGCTVFQYGHTGEFGFDATWNYDGADETSVTFDSELGVNYDLYVYDFSFGHSYFQSAVGTGAEQTISVTAGFSFPGGFVGQLFLPDDSSSRTDRLFYQGVSGAGLLGNPTPEDPVQTFAPTGVSTTTATFEGSVNPEGVDSDVYFEYGLTTGYGTTTPVQAIGSGDDPVPVEQLVTGLRPGRTYHVRVVRDP